MVMSLQSYRFVMLTIKKLFNSTLCSTHAQNILTAKHRFSVAYNYVNINSTVAQFIICLLFLLKLHSVPMFLHLRCFFNIPTLKSTSTSCLYKDFYISSGSILTVQLLVMIYTLFCHYFRLIYPYYFFILLSRCICIYCCH